ncbi:MAG: NfeD family protein [Clostridia bacterium]|nr:NfeD family protein [Clostridia bacterium]
MEYTSALLLWGCLMLVFLLVEALTPQLLSVWFAVGALAALVATLLGAAFWLQILVFVLVSVAVVFLGYPLTKKFRLRTEERLNANRIIGRHGIVVQTVDKVQGTGQVRIDSEIWSAKTEEEEPIFEGARIRVRRIEGVKAVVRLSRVQDEQTEGKEEGEQA